MFWVDECPYQVEKNAYGDDADDDVLSAHRRDTILSAKYA